MTADQRTELLKRLENAGVEKIPLEKCVQIARELDLTVEQVLRASRERWFPCQNLKPNESGEHDLVSAGVTTRKRKRSVSQYRTAHGLFRRSVRSQRFSWTDESDRQLIMRYTRNRVVMGARIHRVDWSSLPDLPAPPATCRRRMAWLRSHENIRRVLMRLCNHLSKRYAKYLEMARTKRKEISEEDPEGQIDPGRIDFCWDDFGDPEVKKVLDEVLEYRKLAKLASISKERPVSQDAKKGGPPGSTSEKDKKNGDADAACTRDRKKENFERRFGDILNSRGEVIRKTVQGLWWLPMQWNY
jgi:general transcription factor 3C polypeptide 1